MVSEDRVIRTDFSRGEMIGGLVWLSLAAVLSAFLEVMYLGTWLTLPDGTRVAAPYTIIIAFLFNVVLTRTARLWTDRAGVAAVPLYAWVATYAVLVLGPAVSGDQLVGNNIRSILLLAAGVSGGLWPIIRKK